MRVLDPLLFLFGDRGAIERIAATRHAWIVGAILVLSAGIARNYDHLDLLREPEWFVGPFVASLVSIVIIFGCISDPLKLTKVGTFNKQLGTFLTFAWMTAPCAWLYGIPVEGMTDLITATKWNIAFLAIVALWRVAIMVRAVAVLTGVKTIRALPLILAPAAFEAMVGTHFKALSMVQIMGGMRLPPHTKLIREASAITGLVSFFLTIFCIVACYLIKGTAEHPLNRPAAGSGTAAAKVAIIALALWALAAIPFHAAIRNRDDLKRLIQTKDYPAAVAFASSKTRADFPPNHYLPPAPDDWRFPFELLEALPPDAPEWLQTEWTANAVDSLTFNLPNSGKWEELEKNHPLLIKAVEAHAVKLRAEPPRGFSNVQWLREYDRLTQPADPEERFHPDKLPPP